MYEKYVQLRETQKLTDYKVAQDTGIPKSTFSEWKNGKYKPKADKLMKLAEYFGVSIEFFLKD
ncbi:transcriptional regulator [Oribacterium sp. C9]|uniref:helix-turn-helix domain-containing protein n=1 Tax=Oribacterium sp. C9 TaxID=1943579 RepID=UPI00098EBF07|nr:helix-turn-helix transcriptional regulator [Oribacterium sp. C9]OON87651.1 transcriptional regulator [Oribacterium sp. C9]